MDYIGEFIILGIDSLIFGICLKKYLCCKSTINAVKDAEFREVDNKLIKLVKKNIDNKIKYVAIRGVIKSLGKPIYSIYNKVVTGVIHKLTLKEHHVVRTSSGYWFDQEQIIQELYTSVPFVIKRGKHEIEVMDAFSAELLDLETTFDTFEPSAPNFVNYVWGFFTGYTQRGIQTTEEMLKEGSIITVIGELITSPHNKSSLILQPPIDGTPYYLTTMSVSSLLRKLDDRKKVYKWLYIIFGSIGIFFACIIIRHYLRDRKKQKLALALRRSLEQSRNERRQRVRDGNANHSGLCVICITNPQEVILLPCGHVSLCEDCSIEYNGLCPICRRTISQMNPIYFP